MELIAFQAQPSFQREGLPYWMFYFLLCVILLLVIFIFLRDKQLRMRISAFLAGARRRSILVRLKFQLKKERQKRAKLLLELGKKAWEKDIQANDSDLIRTELARLLERKKASQLEWKKAYDELERLHRELETAARLHEKRAQEKRAEKEPFDLLMKKKKEEEKKLKKTPPSKEKEIQLAAIRKEKEAIHKEIEACEDRLKDIETEARQEYYNLDKSIRYWTKVKERLEHRIKNIEAQEEALFYSLGKNLEEKRVDGRELEPLYSQIDTINQRITTLLHRIEILSGG